MQVMVMNDDPAVQVRVLKGLRAQGFQVIGMETVARACDYVKADPVDVLIMGERIGGRLSHTVALAAECANPMVTTMLLTDRNDREVDELYDLLPSLYALVGPDNAPSVIATLALSAVANPEEAEARMRRNAMARELHKVIGWNSDDDGTQNPGPDITVEDLWAEAEIAGETDTDTDDTTATWGEEDQVMALARTEDAALGPAPAAAIEPQLRFADVFAAQSDEPPPAPGMMVSLAATAPAIPDVVSALPTVAARIRTPAALMPEIVPARPSRSDWIAARVRELEQREATPPGRLHLA